MATLPDEVLEIINGSPELKSMLYYLDLLPEQVKTELDARGVVYLAYWYRANKDAALKDARGM